jgi:hypothetical protein
MIDSKGLVLDNWLLYTPSGRSTIKPRFVQVKTIYKESCIVIDKGFDLELFYQSATTQPIPLSADLLSKIEGFEVPSNVCYLDVDFFLYKNYDGFWLQVEKQQPTGYVCERLKIPCDYLHQLQNLYFCLSGKQLKINF